MPSVVARGLVVRHFGHKQPIQLPADPHCRVTPQVPWRPGQRGAGEAVLSGVGAVVHRDGSSALARDDRAGAALPRFSGGVRAYFLPSASHLCFLSPLCSSPPTVSPPAGGIVRHRRRDGAHSSEAGRTERSAYSGGDATVEPVSILPLLLRVRDVLAPRVHLTLPPTWGIQTSSKVKAKSLFSRF